MLNFWPFQGKPFKIKFIELDEYAYLIIIPTNWYKMDDETHTAGDVVHNYLPYCYLPNSIATTVSQIDPELRELAAELFFIRCLHKICYYTTLIRYIAWQDEYVSYMNNIISSITHLYLGT